MRLELRFKAPKGSGEPAFKAAFAPYLDRAAAEGSRIMSRRMTANKTMFTSAMLNSVNWRATGDFAREIAPGVEHALYVDQGTRPGYMPPPNRLMEWIRRRPSFGKLARRGSRKRWSQELEVRDRAWALALHIKRHGTQAHPFVKPTADELRPILKAAVAAGAAAGATAMLGSG